MVAIVGPIIGTTALRVLAALGVGVVASAAGEEAAKRARQRKEEAEKAKSAPIARTDATTTAKEKCKKCPADAGSMIPVKWHMNENSRAYQEKITGFPRGMEWDFGGKDFDGFQSGLCLLQETKADYDQFLNEEGTFDWSFKEDMFLLKMMKQATQQSMVVKANKPTALNWYFQTPLAYKYMRPKLTRLKINVLYVP